jgi:hypothetical protein
VCMPSLRPYLAPTHLLLADFDIGLSHLLLEAVQRVLRLARSLQAPLDAELSLQWRPSIALEERDANQRTGSGRLRNRPQEARAPDQVLEHVREHEGVAAAADEALALLLRPRRGRHRHASIRPTEVQEGRAALRDPLGGAPRPGVSHGLT